MKSQSPTPQEKTKMSPSIAIVLILLSCVVVLSLSVSADNCDDVKANLTLGKPSVMTMSCTFPSLASYQVNATTSSTGAITIGGNNVILDCNGSTITGNGTGYGIADNYGRQNITIKNCNVGFYDYNMLFKTNTAFAKNYNILNNILYNSSLDNLLMIGVNNTVIDNLTAFNANGILGHNIYISKVDWSVYNTTIKNSYLYNSKSSCLQFNSATGFIELGLVYNNKIDNCGGNGINQIGANNLNISNNNISNYVGWSAIALDYMRSLPHPINSSGSGTIIENNLFDNSGFAFSIGNYSYNNIIKNNIGNSVKNILVYQVQNFSLIENTTTNLQLNYSYTNANVYLNYSGIKNLSIVNNTITLNGCNGGNCSAYWTHNSTVAFNNLKNATLTIPTNGNLEVKISSASGGCDYPINQYNYLKNTTLCSGTYYLNDSSTNGVIQFNADNIYLNGTGVILIGNNTGKGINNPNSNNGMNIYGFTLINYPTGISAGGNNWNVNNNIVINSSAFGIICSGNSGVNCSANNNFVYNYNLSNSAEGIKLQRGSNMKANNNYIYGYKLALHLQGSANSTLYNNQIDNPRTFQALSLRGILIDQSTTFMPYNLNISNNVISNIDTGIAGNNISNSIIKDNIINNASMNKDIYNTGIYVYGNSNNINLTNNLINKYGSVGLFVQKSTNIIINGLTCNQLSLSEKLAGVIPAYPTNSWVDSFDWTSCIYLGEGFKGYIGDSTESASDTIAKLSTYSITNVSILNVVYDNNVQTILRTMGAYNVQFDSSINNYWYKSYRFPTYLWDKEEFYNSNNFNQLSYVPTNTSGIVTIFERFYFNSQIANQKVNISQSKTALYFKNVNQTTAYNLSLYNLTDQGYPYVDIFYSNQTTPVASDVNEWNGTIAPGNRTIVLNYATDTQPRISQLFQDVDTISITTTSDTTTVTCTGSGFNITNLNYYNGVYVYHDGVLLGYTENTNFTAPSCSIWEFTRAQKVIKNEIIDLDLDAAKMIKSNVSLLPIAIIAVIFAIIIPLFFMVYSNSGREMNYVDVARQSTGSILYLVIGIVVIVIVIILGIAITSAGINVFG